MAKLALMEIVMVYYLSMFMCALFLVGYSEWLFKKNKRRSGMICAILAIALICIFSGFRADNVGVDVEVYIVPQLKYAKSFSSIVRYALFSGMEPMNSVILFFSAMICDDTVLALALYQFLVVVPVYIVLYKKRNEVSITFGMFVYFMLIYNLTLNIMRQSVSGALLFLAIEMFEERKYMKTAILIVFACLFHPSALILVFIYACVNFVIKGRKSLLKKVIATLIVVVLVINIRPIADFIINALGMFNVEYYDRLVNRTGKDINVFECVLRGVLVLFPLICFAKSKSKKTYQQYSYVLLIGYIISFAAIISEYLIRFSYYFYFIFVPVLACVPLRFKANRANRLVIYLFEIILLAIYWYVIYIGWGWHGTVPFSFK